MTPPTGSTAKSFREEFQNDSKHTQESAQLYQRIEECPLCSSKNYEIIRSEEHEFPKGNPYFLTYAKDKIYLKKCTDCEFAFVDKLPKSKEFYDQIYTDLKPNWEIEFYHHGKKAINQEIKQMLLKYTYGDNLLDVGSWAGAFLNEVQDKFKVQGVELNPAGAKFANSKGIKVHNTSFHDTKFEPEQFDVITFTDVLEHLPNPGQILKKATELLKKGGLIYVKVPHYKAQMEKQNILKTLGLSDLGIMQNYVHINHFTRKSLSQNLRKQGCTILESGFTGAEVWDLSVKAAPIEYTKRIFRNFGANLITGTINTLATLTGTELGLNLYVLARKN